MTNTARRRTQPDTRPTRRSVDTKSMPRISDIDPMHVRNALQHAREQEFDEYKGDQSKWLTAHIPPLATAIETMYAATIQQCGPEVADASLLGAYLGGSIVRSVVDSEKVTPELCLGNLAAWNINSLAIVYDGNPVPHGTLISLYGDGAAVEFEQIRHPAARTVCSLIVCVSMAPPVSAV